MKQIKYIQVVLILIVFSITSCKKFLEREPIGRVSRSVLFEDVDGAKVALNGAYKLAFDYYRNEYGMLGDVASDNVKNVPLESNVVMLEAYNFTHTASDDLLSSYHIWKQILEALNNVNNILNALDELKSKYPTKIAQIEEVQGQALVLRALCHLDLSKTFAQPYSFTADGSHLGVPVLTKTPSPGAAVARATMKETYDQIISDLNASLPYLIKYRNGGDQALVSYQAALGLLSRVYLYKGDWTNCINAANKVISDNKYRLASATEYKSSFLTYPAATATPNVETLFHLSGLGLTTVGAKEVIGVYSYPSDRVVQYPASSKLLNSFDASDIRLLNMFKSVGPNKGTNKYADDVFTTSSAYLLKVIRLSEVYLNRAEANWNLRKFAEAAEDIRVISQRAHPNQTIVISYANNADLYQKIADERNRELCFEGHRLHDIVRRKENLVRGSDCNSTVCTLNYPNNKVILPFNVREIDANPALKQNPGYN
jgi:hypothetical protein